MGYKGGGLLGFESRGGVGFESRGGVGLGLPQGRTGWRDK